MFLNFSAWSDDRRPSHAWKAEPRWKGGFQREDEPTPGFGEYFLLHL